MDEIEQIIINDFLKLPKTILEFNQYRKMRLEQLQNGSKHIENTKEQNKPKTIAEATGYQGMYSDRILLEDRK